MQKVYGLYDRSSDVENVHLANEKHDYGPGKRMALYPFIAKHLNLNIQQVLDAKGNVDESKVKLLTQQELSAFSYNHSLPSNAIKGDFK